VQRWIRLVFGMIALGFFAAAAVNGWNERAFLQSASHSQGRVLTQIAGCSSVKIRFEAAPMVFVEFIQNGFICLKPGEIVKIVYAAADPQETARADRMGALWFSTLAPLLAGVCFLLLGWLASRPKKMIRRR
jgi:hypothetical protein